MSDVLDRLINGVDLTEGEAQSLLDTFTNGPTDPVLAGAVLTALRVKGESACEVRGFANGLRQSAIRPHFDDPRDAVDIVGTGGDGSGSLNISTGAALLVAACGLRVIKHGNRSVSSLSGSADLLSALGLKIPLDEVESADCLNETGFTFLFAPHYHPAMKVISPVRGALGIRTIFNMVGPLTNPAAPGFAVIGAYSLDAARLLAEAAAGMEFERAFFIHGAPGWDEATPVGPYHLIQASPGEVIETIEDPIELGIARCEPDDLRGWNADYNARRLRDVFSGEVGPHRDALVLTASLAIRVTGRADDPSTALDLAESAIDDGRALAMLETVGAYTGHAHV